MQKANKIILISKTCFVSKNKNKNKTTVGNDS